MAARKTPNTDTVFDRMESAINDAKVLAINTVARGMWEKSIDLVAKALKVEPDRIAKKTKGSRTRLIRFLAAYGKHPAIISASVPGLPLIESGGQWSRSDPGASYINNSGARIIVPHSFIARLRPRGRSRAAPSIYRRKGKNRFPIKKLTGLGIHLIIRQPEIQNQLTQYFKQNLPAEFNRQVFLRLKK